MDDNASQDSGWERDDEIAETMRAVEEAREDIAAGRVQDIEAFTSDFEKRHGISR